MSEALVKTDKSEVQSAMNTVAQHKVDVLRQACEKLPELHVDCPLVHRFTAGMYVREINVPAGTFIITKIHLTEHPFVVMQGRCAVWVEGVGVVEVKAPYVGITKAGTRRVIYVHEDCKWLTFHATDKTDLDHIEADIILKPNDVESVEIDAEILKQLKN